MGMLTQLILVGVILAALGGAYYSWRSDIKEEGAKELQAQMDKLQKERDLENLALAQKGIEERDRLLKEADRRTKAAWAGAAAEAKARKAASDERAKDDRDYALWREQPLPPYVTGRLRDATVIGATEDSGNLPSGTPVQTENVVPAAPDNEWGIGRIRAFFDRAVADRVEGGTAGQK